MKHLGKFLRLQLPRNKERVTSRVQMSSFDILSSQENGKKMKVTVDSRSNQACGLHGFLRAVYRFIGSASAAATAAAGSGSRKSLTF